MRHVRPVVRDSLAGSGLAVVATRHVRDGAVAPRRAPATHSYAVLVFNTGGRSRVEQKGEWNLREGDVLLVPAGEPHRVLGTGRLEFWGLAFCVPCFAADGTASLLEPFERVRGGASALSLIHI